MNPAARVGHAIPGRTRIRVPSMRGDADYFARAAASLEGHAGIHRVRANIRAGSIVIDHSADLELAEIVGYGESAQLFTLEETRDAVATAAQQAAATLKRLDKRLRETGDSATDMRSAMMLGLLLLGVVQLVRGQVLGPAFAYFWYAFQLMGGPPDFDSRE